MPDQHVERRDHTPTAHTHRAKPYPACAAQWTGANLRELAELVPDGKRFDFTVHTLAGKPDAVRVEVHAPGDARQPSPLVLWLGDWLVVDDAGTVSAVKADSFGGKFERVARECSALCRDVERDRDRLALALERANAEREQLTAEIGKLRAEAGRG